MRSARKRLKLSQAELGQLCGLSGRVVSNIEHNRRPLNAREAEMLKKYFAARGLELKDTSTSGETADTTPRIRLRIVVEKDFTSVNAETIVETAKLIEAIRSICGDWEVSCKLR